MSKRRPRKEQDPKPTLFDLPLREDGADPENEELKRLLLFSQSYENKSQDLLYLIFVKYLPSR